MASRDVLLLASGDLRLSANQNCWAAQRDVEERLAAAVASLGYSLRGLIPTRKPSDTASSPAKEGMEIFRSIPPMRRSSSPRPSGNTRITCCRAVDASRADPHRRQLVGQWPGLVGMLNLNGSLTKAGVKYSTLWSEDFTDELFHESAARVADDRPRLRHDAYARRARSTSIKLAGRHRESSASSSPTSSQREKAIMGVFDEGCMGMFNAIIPDDLLHRDRRLQGTAQPVGPVLRNDAGRATTRRGRRPSWMEDTGHEVRHRPEPRRAT